MLTKIIKQFIFNMDSLRDFVKAVSGFIAERGDEFAKSNAHSLLPLVLGFHKLNPELFELPFAPEKVEESFGGKITIKVKRGHSPKSVSISVSQKKADAFDDAVNAWLRTLNRKDILFKSSLINLTSTSEWFLAQLFHLYYDKYPDPVGSQDNVFSLEDLRKLGSIEEARRFLIEMKVENIIRGNFCDWIKILKERLKLSMGYLEPNKDKIIEVYQRRNLIVHNGGLINSIYLANTASSLHKGHKVGDSIPITPDYLEESLNLFELTFILIAAELWKQLEPTKEERGNLLNSVSFEHLDAERWCVAEGLCHFVIQDRQLPENERLIAQLNYWQSLKWQGRYESIREEVAKADFSVKAPVYQLGRFAISDNAQDFFRLLPKVVQAGEITKEDIWKWPIFREMRKDKRCAKFLPVSTATAVKKAEFKQECQVNYILSRIPIITSRLNGRINANGCLRRHEIRGGLPNIRHVM